MEDLKKFRKLMSFMGVPQRGKRYRNSGALVEDDPLRPLGGGGAFFLGLLFLRDFFARAQ